MSDWNMGYNTDILYTNRYFAELNPLRVQFNLLSQGYAFPPLDDKMTCCELGFGLGLSVLMHSAAGPAWWAGTDFAPNQALYAQHLAQEAGLNTLLTDDSFAEFLARKDLPQFDFIALHGIWTWVAPRFQEEICAFINKRLKVGGVVYISYNVAPGFLSIEPLRHLMHEYVSWVGLGVERAQQLKQVKDFLARLEQVAPVYYEVFPSFTKQLKDNLQHDLHYLVHEYLNDAWDIVNRNELVHKLQEQAQLTYITQPDAYDQIRQCGFNAKQQALLGKVQGTPLAQALFDLIDGAQFVRDYYGRGSYQLSAAEQLEQLEQCYFLSLIGEVKPGEKIVTISGDEILIKHKTHIAMLNFLQDFKPRSFKELRAEFKGTSLEQSEILVLVLLTLINKKAIVNAVPDYLIAPETKERCAKLNAIIWAGKYDNEVNFLASPVIQGGIQLTDVDMLLLRYYVQYQVRDAEVFFRILKATSTKKPAATSAPLPYPVLVRPLAPAQASTPAPALAPAPGDVAAPMPALALAPAPGDVSEPALAPALASASLAPLAGITTSGSVIAPVHTLASTAGLDAGAASCPSAEPLPCSASDAVPCPTSEPVLCSASGAVPCSASSLELSVAKAAHTPYVQLEPGAASCSKVTTKPQDAVAIANGASAAPVKDAELSAAPVRDAKLSAAPVRDAELSAAPSCATDPLTASASAAKPNLAPADVAAANAGELGEVQAEAAKLSVAETSNAPAATAALSFEQAREQAQVAQYEQSLRNIVHRFMQHLPLYQALGLCALPGTTSAVAEDGSSSPLVETEPSPPLNKSMASSHGEESGAVPAIADILSPSAAADEQSLS